MEIDHLTLVVSSADVSAAWYVETLGATIAADRLTFDNIHLELTQTDSARPYELRANDPGAFHICVRVADLEDEYRRLQELGVRTTTPPGELVAGTGMLTMFTRDPDGILVQLLELPGTPPAQPADVHHIGITVSDLERAARWHNDTLGLEVLSWHENDGELLSSMFEVSDSHERAALIAAGNVLIELMQWVHPVGRPFRTAPTDVGAGRLSLRARDDPQREPGLLSDPDRIPFEVVG